jgi:NTP pyrophosphatase (non-canonical NTP hydrolase)
MSQDLQTMISKATQVRDHYRELQETDGQKKWDVSDYMAGFVGDVGDLSKLIMAKQDLRRGPDNLDGALAHEVADCLWSVLVIANELNVDIETEFNKTMGELDARIERQKTDPSLLK